MLMHRSRAGLRHPPFPMACLVSRPVLEPRRLLALAAILSLIGAGVPDSAVEFCGVSVLASDENPAGQPQHEAPAEESDEEEQTKSEQKSESGTDALAVGAVCQGVELGAGRLVGTGAFCFGSLRTGSADLSIRGPPVA